MINSVMRIQIKDLADLGERILAVSAVLKIFSIPFLAADRVEETQMPQGKVPTCNIR